MSAKPNDGGPAFPWHSDGMAEHEPPSTGMSLRDYFAAKIAAAIIGTSEHTIDGTGVCDMLSSESINPGGVPCNKYGDRSPLDLALRWVPKTAYAFADAMLAARNGGAT